MISGLESCERDARFFLGIYSQALVFVRLLRSNVPGFRSQGHSFLEE